MRRRAEDSKRVDAATTRARLVEAGVQIFASQTYEEASVRAIAEEAGVNVAMVSYHFQGKSGLYKAVVERIIATGHGVMAAIIVEARGLLSRSDPDPAQAKALALTLLRSVLETTRRPQTLDLARIMLREQLDPSSMGDGLHDELVSPLLTTLAGLLAASAGRSAPERSDLVRAFALLGQAIVLRAVRYSTIRLLGSASATDGDVAVMMELFDRQIAA